MFSNLKSKKEFLSTLVTMALTGIFQQQRKNKVPCLDANQVDEALVKLSQLPHDRLRGLAVIAIIDDGNPEGFKSDVTLIGTADMLEASTMFLRDQVDVAKTHARGPAFADLEELLRRGPGDPRGAPFGGFPHGSRPADEDIELLGLLMAMSAMRR